MKPGKATAGGLGMLRDRRVQLAAAGAAVLGLVVMLRRGAAGGVTGDTIQPAAGFDSSGVDAYNAIQAVGAGWSNDLRQFTDTLTSIQQQLGQRPPAGTGSDYADRSPIVGAQSHRIPPAGSTASVPSRPRNGGGIVPGGSPVPGNRLPPWR